LPATQTFGPAPCVGTTFTITCEVHGVTNLYGVDIQIGWDTVYLGYVSHVKMIPVETYPTGILHSPTIPVKNQVDETASMPGAAPGTMYWLSEASMVPAVGFTGSGIAFSMTFTIKTQGMPGDPDITTYIHITDSTLADTNGQPISHDRYDGEVIILSRPLVYPADPLLYIDPASVSGVQSGNTFESDVNLAAWDGAAIVDLDAFWDVAGFDITYNFDPTLIQANTVTFDPWFATFWPGGIFIVKADINNIAGTVWVVFLGIPGVGGDHIAPYGQGTLFTIEFESIYDSTTAPPLDCALTLAPTTIAGFPHPERSYAPWFNSESSIPLDHFVQNGLYTSYYLALGRAIDLWTCSYPDGFNGAGPSAPADMFWPQKGIYLCANVTYNLWPVQQKDVAFEVRDPLGNLWGIFYGRTDANGEVCLFVRLPWPCDNPEQYFGIWKITATVDIACVVVKDTMEFKLYYRVMVWKTTLVPDPPYDHTDTFTVHIEYYTYSQQTFNVLFTATATDELGVPFAYGQAWVLPIEPAPQYCTYKNGFVDIPLYIPKFAAAGIGHVYVGVLENWPSNNGAAWYPTRAPETIVEFYINAS
jgi:hypothetical protein